MARLKHMIDWHKLISLLVILAFGLTFVSMVSSGTKGWAWAIWGLILSFLWFVVSFGRSKKPGVGKPIYAEAVGWKNPRSDCFDSAYFEHNDGTKHIREVALENMGEIDSITQEASQQTRSHLFQRPDQI